LPAFSVPCQSPAMLCARNEPVNNVVHAIIHSTIFFIEEISLKLAKPEV
jgi:hypothetical protein